ncbi:MAG TPA: hypothetical protein VGO73_12175 [Pyrinomonadaceae bacterium]|jgi:hypothetical protein|nr:hypothetical protein [Pyrinomonadaceae bacterium]
MNQYQVKMQARRLMDSQEKFVTTVYMLFEVLEKFNETQRTFREELIARDNWYEAARREAQAQKAMTDTLLESITGLHNAYRETHATVDRNTERMEKLLTKVEAYFGTTGLDYDN